MPKYKVPNWSPNSRPENFDVTTLARSGDLGVVYEENTKRWQIAQLVDAVTVAAGDALYWKSQAGYTVTPTISNSSAGELAGFAEVIATAANDFIAVRQGGIFSVKANGVFIRGTPVWADSGNNRVIPAGVFSGALGVVATAGGIFSVANPCTGAWTVTDLYINRTTKSTGAASLDAGIAANGTTLSDTLIDGLNLNATEANNENNWVNGGGDTAFFNNVGAAGTFLTGSTVGAADPAGLVGTFSGRFRPITTILGNLPIIGYAQGAAAAGKVSVYINIPSI